MKIFTVYNKDDLARPLENTIILKEGFSWNAAIFQPLWALYHKMWSLAAILLLLNLATRLLLSSGVISDNISAVIELTVFVIIGLCGNDWISENLMKNGYTMIGIVSGRDKIEAEQRFFDNYIAKNPFGIKS